MSRWRARRVGRDRGASSIELALLGPVVITLTFISIQFALWYHAKNVAQASVEAGARASRAYQATNADGQTAAASTFSTLKGSDVTAGSPTIISRRNAGYVTVELHTTSIALLPGLNFPVDATAGGPIEQFVGP